MQHRIRRRARRWAVAAVPLALGVAVSAVASTAGATAPRKITPKPITIGVAAITLGSPVVPEMVSTIEAGAKVLGWHVTVLNANGDPSTMASDFSSLVNENVNAIIDIAEQPSVVQAGMQAARSKHIPILEVGAPLIDPNHYALASYMPSDAKMARMLAKQMITDMHGKGEALDLAASAIPAIVIRENTLKAATKHTGIKVVVTHQTDLANPIADTQTAVIDAVRANPGLDIIWALQDFEFSASLQAIQAQHLSSKIGVFAFYLDPIDFSLLRADKGGRQPEAVVDSPIQYSPWFALDSLINKFVLKKAKWITPMSIHPLPYALVTPQNVQAKGNTYHYPSFQAFFLKRWRSEGIALK